MTGLRWGILGLGGIANAFIRDLIANGMIVAAVGSRSQEKAKAFAAAHGVEAAFGSYENLADAPDVDAIYVATPHPFHAEAAALAIKAGNTYSSKSQLRSMPGKPLASRTSVRRTMWL